MTYPVDFYFCGPDEHDRSALNNFKIRQFPLFAIITERAQRRRQLYLASDNFIKECTRTTTEIICYKIKITSMVGSC